MYVTLITNFQFVAHAQAQHTIFSSVHMLRPSTSLHGSLCYVCHVDYQFYVMHVTWISNYHSKLDKDLCDHSM